MGSGVLRNFQTTSQLVLAWESHFSRSSVVNQEVVCTHFFVITCYVPACSGRRILHPVLLFPGRYKRAASSLTVTTVSRLTLNILHQHTKKTSIEQWIPATAPRVSVNCYVLSQHFSWLETRLFVIFGQCEADLA